MAQISKGDTFVDGQQVTGARLNQLVDSSILLVGSISDQTAIATNGVANTDEFPVNDSGVLKKAKASDILNSGLAITTGSISGNTGADLVITPAVGQKVDIAGNIEADDINVTDDLTVAGDITVTGASTLTGNVIADNGFTSNGTANFTGAFQFNGSAVYSLAEIVEEDIPNSTGAAANTLHSLWTSASYTKPAGEIWVVEFNTTVFAPNNNTNTHLRFTDSADSVKYALGYFYNAVTNSVLNFSGDFYLNSANTFSGTFVLRAKSNQTNISVTPTGTQLTTSYPDNTQGTSSKFRIFKYKTA